MNFKLYNILFFYIILQISIGCANLDDSTTITTAHIPEGIEAIVLENGMRVDVFVPANYNPQASYPLLILNDGESMFSPVGWNAQNVVQRLIDDNEIIPIVVVAVHTNGKRNNWYIPYEDEWINQNWGRYTPQADIYAHAILNEVIPEIANRYSINQTEVAMMGASLGGLISTWMGIRFPEKIKYSAGLSGSLWVADYKIFEEVDQNYSTENKFWFDIGTSEWNYYVPLYRTLTDSDLIAGEQSFYYEVPEGRHTNKDWLERIDLPLKVFFGVEKEPTLENLEVVLQCIPSQSTPGKKFRRLNPIATLSNGVKFSLAHNATYTLESGEVQLGTEGSLLNNPDMESIISISYQAFSDTLAIPIGWCR